MSSVHSPGAAIGAVFVSLVAVVCGRFAAVENTVLASNRFFYGACWAVLASIVPVFFLIPLADGFGALTLAIAPFMLLGGLALLTTVHRDLERADAQDDDAAAEEAVTEVPAAPEEAVLAEDALRHEARR